MSIATLKKLFQSKLDETPVPLKLDKEWLKLESDLDNKAFLNFRWNKFNVYYLSTFVGSFCLAGTALFMAIQKPANLIHTKKILIDTVYVYRVLHDTITIRGNGNSLVVNSSKEEMTHGKGEDVKSESKEVAVEKTLEINTAQPTEQPIKPELKQPVVYQYKRDTIIKYDSVKVSKRELKKMKRNP